MEAKTDEAEQIKRELLDSNDELTRLQQRASEVRKEIKARKKANKDRLAELAQEGLIEWDSAYRRRQNT